MHINRRSPITRPNSFQESAASAHPATRAARQLKSRQRISMGVFALLTGFTQVVVHTSVRDQADIVRVFNGADQQRMLCQRMSNAALALERIALSNQTADEDERAGCAAELRFVIAAWEPLQAAMERLNRPRDSSHQISPQMRQMVARIAMPRSDMLRVGAALLAANARPGRLDARQCAANAQTAQAQGPVFMKEMDEYVYAFEHEVTASNERLQRFASGMLVGMLLILVLQSVCVFRPALARMRQCVAELLNAQTCIEQQNTELRANNALLEAQQAELEAQQDELAAQQDELEQQARERERHNTELRLLNQLLEQRATTDGLTGLKNHSAFRRELEKMAELAAHNHRPLSVILLDVDHFKQYNDMYGHPGGDEVLRQVARLLQCGARATDVVARYGGEEFIVLLPETDALKAGEVAESLRHALATHTWEARAVTASFGVASFAPDASDTADASELIDRADRALYHAKRQGRNRVQLADAGEEYQERRRAA